MFSIMDHQETHILTMTSPPTIMMAAVKKKMKITNDKEDVKIWAFYTAVRKVKYCSCYETQ